MLPFGAAGGLIAGGVAAGAVIGGGVVAAGAVDFGASAATAKTLIDKATTPASRAANCLYMLFSLVDYGAGKRYRSTEQPITKKDKSG
jgi:hypothetical protein